MEIEYLEMWDVLTLLRNNSESFRLGIEDQRKIISWFFKHKPELVSEIIHSGV